MAGDATLEAAAQVGATPSDLDLIAQLQERVGVFQMSRAELQRLGAAVAATTDNDLWQQYGDLVARADSLESTIQGALDAVDSAIRYAKNALGLGAVRRLGGLGIVWLIPVAIIAAAIAALGYWLTDFAKVRARILQQQSIAQQLQAAGVDAAEANRQASAAVAASQPSGILDTALSLAKYALAIGVGWWLWRKYGR